MNSSLRNHISNILGVKILNAVAVSGGDISNAFKLETESKDFFFKFKNSAGIGQMFKLEAEGLNFLAKTNTIAVPEVLRYGQHQETDYLLLQFVETKSPDRTDMALLGRKLADLHRTSAEQFGLDYDNFIGSLKQSNKYHDTWLDFYILERLVPQLSLALSNKLLSKSEIPSIELMRSNLRMYLEGVSPSLLHGDLWSGNFIISDKALPYIIDPAIYFGHSEVDIAMSKLFGGFGDSFYQSYFRIFAKDKYTDARIEIYQLYYLLVHLNLFGKSYFGGVIAILKKYF